MPKNEPPSVNKIPLSEVIASLREELEKARAAGRGKTTRFELQETTIELEVTLTREAGGKLGFDCWLYKAEGQAGLEQANAQKIIIKMKPIGDDGEDYTVSDQDRVVAPPTNKGAGK